MINPLPCKSEKNKKTTPRGQKRKKSRSDWYLVTRGRKRGERLRKSNKERIKNR